MPGPSDLDIYQRFELELRTPQRRLLLDAFLPAPETLESYVTPPPAPPPLPGESPEELALGSLRDRQEPAPEPPPKTRKKKPAPKKAVKAQSLQEEIDEFMKRDNTALAPEGDLGPFQAPPLDPGGSKPDPEGGTEPDKK